MSSPLYYAILYRSMEAICMLIELGARINDECCDGYVPLVWAIAHNRYDVCKVLLEYGARISEPVIELVIENNHYDLCGLLIQYNVPIPYLYRALYDYGERNMLKVASDIINIPLKAMLLAILKLCAPNIYEVLICKRYKPSCLYDANVNILALLLDEGISVNHLPAVYRIWLSRQQRGNDSNAKYHYVVADPDVYLLDEDEISPRDLPVSINSSKHTYSYDSYDSDDYCDCGTCRTVYYYE